jgi:hypothetical protein
MEELQIMLGLRCILKSQMGGAYGKVVLTALGNLQS